MFCAVLGNPRMALAQFTTLNPVASAGGACSNSFETWGWPDANGNVLKCVSNVWQVQGVTATFSGLTTNDFCTATSGTAIACNTGWTGTGSVVLAASPSLTGSITDTQAPASNTSIDGIILIDTTAASSGNQQYSPRLHFSGQGWETGSGASQSVDFIQELQPVQGATNPSGNLVWSNSINGGAYTPLLTLTSAGYIGVGSTTASGGSTHVEMKTTWTSRMESTISGPDTQPAM